MTARAGPLGIGIVGAGLIADAHAQAAYALTGLRVAAVQDHSAAAAGALAARYGATVAPDLAALLADDAVDVVVIATPNDTHAALAVAVAAAGKHLLLEKPLALSVADAEAVVATFAGRGLTLLVGHTHRHSDYARAVTAALRAGAVGTPRSMRIAITAGWLWGNWGAWVLDPARSGGHALHNGVHLYDLAHWWMGSRVLRVYSMGQKITSAALEIDDALVATLEFANGATAICEISRGERPKATNMFEIVVHGSAGTLVRRWNSDGSVALTDDLVGPISAAATSPFARQLAVLRAAVVDGTPIFPDAADAVHSIAIAAAVELSSRTGEVIEVPATRERIAWSSPLRPRVLLAGTGTTENRQHHQAGMYLPALQSLEGFEVAGVWAPDTLDGSRAAELAGAACAPLFADLARALADEVSLVIVCPDPARPQELAQLLQQAAEAQVQVLVDKPTLLPTADLTDLAQRFPAAVAAHHPRFHPALTATRGRIASGGLGLLHAIHGELLVGQADGPHPAGELRNLAVYALDVVQSLIGDLHGRAHAVIAPPGPDGSGEAITLSLRCRPDVVVSLLVGRSGGQAVEGAATTVHRYRILGSHGQLLVDLDSPAFDLYGPRHRRLPFGPTSVQAMIQSVAAGVGRPTLAVAAGLSRVIDGLAGAVAQHRAVDI